MGLGLQDFLTHNEGGGNRKFFDWKKAGKATVWLSTRASIAYPAWTHQFREMGSYKTKEGDEVETLRYPRFVSPDPEIVCASQFFRDENTDRLKVPPIKDPFLLLREWLRFECDEPLDTVVFEWYDPKEEKKIKWTRAQLSRLKDRGKNWSNSLDAKLDYYFVIVDNEKPEDGPQIHRATKLLGDAMKAAIAEQMQSNGDDGNPMLNPYAFRWIFEKNQPPMKMYRAFRYNKAELTDEIREAITQTDFPSPEPDTNPKPGDKNKIRAAMEDAAQIDIPWDRIFVDAWDDQDPASFNPEEFAEGEEEEGDDSEEEKPTPEVKTESKGPKTRRRKKKEKAKPPPKPEPERIPCDECGHMMLPTDTKCENCGAEYEIDDLGESDDDDPEPAPKNESKAKANATEDGKCWACGNEIDPPDAEKCPECGIELADDMPY